MTKPIHSTAIETLEPALVWRLFAGMAAVPRPSKKEGRIRAHVRSVVEQAGFVVREDPAGNMLIEVPPSPECEAAPVTVLQGHLDMVCEKNADTEHDFDNDPIRLIVDEHAADGELIVRADGTTLGADNGIGVALALAAACSPDVRHGPLELLCTVDEEAGMSGAKLLTPDFFKGRRMLNLDTEEDDTICIGCAGGCETTLAWELATGPLPAGAKACRVTVAGLQGGHSGSDIHLNRGNAIKLLVRTLRSAEVDKLQLIDISGGRLRNVIPREASALVTGPPRTLEALRRSARQVQAETVQHAHEQTCAIQVDEATSSQASALSHEDTRRLLTALAALPCGVLAVVPEMAGLVQTSNNVATVAAAGGSDGGALRVTIGCLSRSSSAPQVQEVVRQIVAIGQLAGAAAESGNAYPGWQPDVNSATLAVCRRVYEDLFGKPPRVIAVHAGLECGVIGEQIGGMDMVSFGPRVVGGHSPDEHVYVASVQKSWRYLTAVLAELARG